jgi:phospholipase C
VKDLSRIQNIVIVFMENRSFDHLLGYLNLPGNHPRWQEINGITEAMHYYAGSPYRPHPLTTLNIDPDPPHERENVDREINSPGKPMQGFVDSYARAYPHARADAVMEYCGPKDVYITDALARNFLVCDQWHACLPASTLPNRLMAMSGYALVDRTPNGYLEFARNLFYDNPDDLVYDWLESRSASWRLYYSGSFFFMQMPRMLKKYEQDFSSQNLFRPIHRLIDDFRNGDAAQVTFIEPLYEDDYRRNNQQATDDHPPAALAGGQRFLKMVWEAVKSPGVWENLLLLLSYDEHGSIFDHVMPPSIPTDPPPQALYTERFKTLGVRVPGIAISPFVEPGTVCSKLFDHTSVLKLLGEKFNQGAYSRFVDNRAVNSLSEVLSDVLLDPNTPIRKPPDKP